jgi:hypothetical protein
MYAAMVYLSIANLTSRAAGYSLIIISKGSQFAALVLLVDVLLYFAFLAMRRERLIILVLPLPRFWLVFISCVFRAGFKFGFEYSGLVLGRHPYFNGGLYW